jgi:hypothetical protein
MTPQGCADYVPSWMAGICFEGGPIPQLQQYAVAYFRQADSQACFCNAVSTPVEAAHAVAKSWLASRIC